MTWDAPPWATEQEVPSECGRGDQPGGRMTLAGPEELKPYREELQRDPVLAAAVQDVLRRRRAQQIAAEVEDRRRGQQMPDVGTLAELLARPVADSWRIEGLLPTGGRMLWSAQRKTGKTTAVNNLARSLLTGARFLGSFDVRPLAGRVVVLNYEVTGEQFARWATDVGVPGDRMFVVNLRGRRNLLADEEGREQLVELIRRQEGEVLVVDPFGRAYTGKSQNDSAEVTPWLVRLDEVAERAGVAELILTAHAGWDGERTRGSSALEDWPDVIVTMTRDAETDERFIKAEGRDVDLDEDRLTFSATTRRLYLTGDGSRKQARASKQIERLAEAIRDVVALEPEGLSLKPLREALSDRGEHFQRGDVGKASALAEERGWVRIEKGQRNARLHFPPATRTDSYQPVPGTSATRTDPSYRDGTGRGANQEPLVPSQDELVVA